MLVLLRPALVVKDSLISFPAVSLIILNSSLRLRPIILHDPQQIIS